MSFQIRCTECETITSIDDDREVTNNNFEIYGYRNKWATIECTSCGLSVAFKMLNGKEDKE